jgi:hypothetical protein
MDFKIQLLLQMLLKITAETTKNRMQIIQNTAITTNASAISAETSAEQLQMVSKHSY